VNNVWQTNSTKSGGSGPKPRASEGVEEEMSSRGWRKIIPEEEAPALLQHQGEL